MIDAAGIILQRAMAHGIGDDGVNLGLQIAQVRQGFGHAAVDDLEIAAARQGLELYQREVRLHARGVAVHHQADGAGGRDHGGLGVAEAMFLAKAQRIVPGALGCFGQRLVVNRPQVQRHRQGGELLVTLLLAMGGAAMVADHPQHGVLVGGIFGEGAQLARHLGRGGIGDAGHQRRDGAGCGAAFAAVIGHAGAHQQAADIGKAQAQGAVVIGKLRDFLAGELRHQHRDFQHDGPQPHGMFERLDVKRLDAVALAELHQVQ